MQSQTITQDEYVDVESLPNPHSKVDWIPQNKILAIPPKKALDVTSYLTEGKSLDVARQTVGAFLKKAGRMELKPMVRDGRLYVCNMAPEKHEDNNN